jgi:hypothetical protein
MYHEQSKLHPMNAMEISNTYKPVTPFEGIGIEW